MTERPILFSAPMVRAILDGRKTQTRRVLLNRGAKPDYRGPRGCEDDPDCWGWENGETGEHIGVAPATDGSHDTHWSGPYSKGDMLWVREAWSGDHAFRNCKPSERQSFTTPDGPMLREWIWYWADGEPDHGDWEKTRPSIHMPRWASRITLAVTDVRVERLQGISEDDAIHEGCRPFFDHGDLRQEKSPNGGTIDMAPLKGPLDSFRTLWDGLNASRGYGWDANPWVVAITFTPEAQP